MDIEQHLQSYIDAVGKLNVRISEEYKVVEEYVLREGHLFDSTEMTELEMEWIDTCYWTRHKKRECFSNAQMLALAAWRIPVEIELKYVEGYVLPNIVMPVYHAWLSINGKIMDTTLSPPGKVRKRNRIFGNIPDSWEYYGVEMNPEKCKHIFNHNTHIALIDDWECHWPMLRARNDILVEKEKSACDVI